MKPLKSLLLASLTVVSLGTMAPAFAQLNPGTVAQYVIPGLAPLPNQAAWNQYLYEHHDAAEELQANPGLMYDPEWRARHPHFQNFIDNHPNDWTFLRSQGSSYYDGKFNTFLNNHPEIASDLRHDPSLLYDPAYRRNHHVLNDYLGNHPNVWANLKQEGYAGRGPGRGWGDWDDRHQWRDADWWRDNNPEWARQHHRDWWDRWHNDGDWDDYHRWHDADWWRDHNAQWARDHRRDWWDRWHNDGDWDDDHQWHSRDWWRDHRADWAREHHPDWWDRREAVRARHEAHEEWKERKHEAHEDWKEQKREDKWENKSYKHHRHGHGHDDD